MATRLCRRCGGRFERRDETCSWCGYPVALPDRSGLLRFLLISFLVVTVCTVSGAAVFGRSLYQWVQMASEPADEPVLRATPSPEPAEKPTPPAEPEPAAPTTQTPTRPAPWPVAPKADPAKPAEGIMQVPETWMPGSLFDGDGGREGKLDPQRDIPTP
jgi:hypothetical protein